MNIGDKVRVLPPFDQQFPGTYPVLSVFADGSCYVDLGEGGDASGPNFDAQFLQRVS